MDSKPDFTPDELATVRRWLKQQARSSYARAPIAYHKGDNARALVLYEENDTAWRWVHDIDADLERQQRRGAWA